MSINATLSTPQFAGATRRPRCHTSSTNMQLAVLHQCCIITRHRHGTATPVSAQLRHTRTAWHTAGRSPGAACRAYEGRQAVRSVSEAELSRQEALVAGNSATAEPSPGWKLEQSLLGGASDHAVRVASLYTMWRKLCLRTRR